MKSIFFLLFALKCFAGIPLEEMRIDIEDLKHTLHGLQVDLNLLDGKWKQGSDEKKGEQFDKKLGALEKRQEKLHADLLTISDHLNQIHEKWKDVDKVIQLQHHYQEEISKLKGMLTTLVKTIKMENGEGKTFSKYRVKRGDSLEKIAKAHHITTEALKKENTLSDDRIFEGQELSIPKTL